MVNKQFLTAHDNAEEEVLGRLYESISPWQEKTAEACPVDQVFNSGESITVVKQYQETTDDWKWFERHLTPITDEQGRVDFVVEAVNDITDQVMLEQEHSQRMKLQGVIEMAGTAAHELNTPLFAALGTAQLLRDDLSSPEMVEEIDLIISNMKKMGDLTSKMVEVTGYSSSEYVGETRILALKQNNSGAGST